jgi:hypothetical protein
MEVIEMSAVATRSRTEASLCAAPRYVTDPKECYFYHTFDLPDGGVLQGSWDLRDDVDNYLGHVDLRGKRVLELGTASGYLCFEMEKRGADVVGYDLSDQQGWDLVPYANPEGQVDPTGHKSHIRMLNNSWWYTHRIMRSKASVVYGSIYEVPEAIGPVDVATFGSVLLHLENPFRALERACRLVTETVIVTEINCHWPFQPQPPIAVAPPPQGFRGWLLRTLHDMVGDSDWSRRETAAVAAAATAALVEEMPLTMFLPNGALNNPKDTWWYLRPNYLRQMLGVLGFPETRVSYHTASYNGNREKLFTVVGQRAAGDKGKRPALGYRVG